MTLIDMYAIEAAIQAERPLLITYVAADGERTTRTIEPYELAATRSGFFIVRSMDRRSGAPRSFRLDRIEYVSVMSGSFVLQRPAERVPVEMPEILVRYHGSHDGHHGVMRLLGVCGCARCADSGERYRLAEVGGHRCAVKCVRARSVSALTDEEIAARRAEAAAEAAQEAALARIRAEIAQVEPAGYCGDAVRWTPGDHIFTP
jgi:hypothetical protein